MRIFYLFVFFFASSTGLWENLTRNNYSPTAVVLGRQGDYHAMTYSIKLVFNHHYLIFNSNYITSSASIHRNHSQYLFNLIWRLGFYFSQSSFCAFIFLLSQTYYRPIIWNLMWTTLIKKWHNQDLTTGFPLELYIFALLSFSIIISVSIFHWVNLLQSLVTLEKMTNRPAASETAACFPALSPGCHWHAGH